MLICKCKLVHNWTKLNVLCCLGAHGIYHTIDLHMKRGQRGGEGRGKGGGGGGGVVWFIWQRFSYLSPFLCFFACTFITLHTPTLGQGPPIGVNCLGNAKTKLVSKIPNSSTKLL
jgi:hypothetical protein